MTPRLSPAYVTAALLMLLACEPPRPVVPPASSAVAASTAAPAASPAPKVAVAPSAVPTATATASAVAAAPACPPEPARAPVSVVARHQLRSPLASIGRLQFATPDAALAPSLLDFQRAVDGWLDGKLAGMRKDASSLTGPAPCFGTECFHYSMGCSVVRNDGEFLSVHCFAAPVMYAKYMDAHSFLARRIGGSYRLQTIDQLLPSATGAAVALLKQHCGEDEELDWFGLQTHTLYARFQANHPSGGNCWLPYAKIRPWHGCSSLMAPTDVDGAAQDVANPPLSYSLGAVEGINPYADVLSVWTPYAARASLAATLRERLRRYLAAERTARGESALVNCGVSTSTGSIFSASCSSSQAPINLSYRLRDGTPIEVTELLMARNAKKVIAKACMPEKGSPMRPRKVPKLTAADINSFMLQQTGVVFEVTLPAVPGQPPTHQSCFVPFNKLGTNAALLAKR